MKMKKLTAVLMTAALTLSLAACGTSGQEEPAGKSEEGSSGESGQASADGAVELEFWTMGDGSEDDAYYLKGIVEEFNQEYEGEIYVNRVALGAGNEDQQTKYQLAAGGNQLPDMMEMNSGSFIKEMIEADVLYDMQDYLGTDTDFTGRFKDGALDMATNNYYSQGTFYAFPTETEIQGWYYNKAIFEDAGLEIPETWEDFLNCVKVFKQKGITPIAHGGLDPWPLWGYHAWFSRYGLTAETWEKIMSGEVKAADCDELRKPFERVLELAQAGAFPENITSMNNTQAQELFVGGGAAMYACGSWKMKDMDECAIANEIVFNFGPEFSDGVLSGKSGMRPYSWVIAFGSRLADDPAKAEAAAVFCKWLTSPERTKIEIESFGHIPAAAVDTDAVTLGPVGMITMEAAQADVISVVDPTSVCPDSSLVSVYWNALTSLLSQTIDVDEALSQIQDWADRL